MKFTMDPVPLNLKAASCTRLNDLLMKTVVKDFVRAFSSSNIFPIFPRERTAVRKINSKFTDCHRNYLKSI